MSWIDQGQRYTRRTVPVLAGAAALALIFTAMPSSDDVADTTLASPSSAAGSSADGGAGDASDDLTAAARQQQRDIDAVVGTVPRPPTRTGPAVATPPPSAPSFPLPPSGPSDPGAVLSEPEAACTALPNEEMPDFFSPYNGKSGAWDGKGGTADTTHRRTEMEAEVAMGLTWTFSPIYWSAFEPDGPTSPDNDPTGAWAQFDQFVRDAHERGLQIFAQAPVVGGNAGGPPEWAGRRQAGTSAPEDMQALVDFAGKLVERYKPCGTLALEEGWSDGYGIRVWEMDNEPDSYLTNWDDVADDYAEFVVRTAERIKEIDPHALVAGPAIASPIGEGAQHFLEAILDKGVQAASQTYQDNGVEYAVGPSVDVVTFHNYELNDSVFCNCDGTIQPELDAIREPWLAYADQPGWEFDADNLRFWHTEGGYDFALDEPAGFGRRENWIIQFFARAFSHHVDRVVIQDQHRSPAAQVSVRTMVTLLPNPHPLVEVTEELGYSQDEAYLYRNERASDGGWTYIAYAENQTAGTTVELPVRGPAALVRRDGTVEELEVSDGTVTVDLPGLTRFSAPVFVVELTPAAPIPLEDDGAPAARVHDLTAQGRSSPPRVRAAWRR